MSPLLSQIKSLQKDIKPYYIFDWQLFNSHVFEQQNQPSHAHDGSMGRLYIYLLIFNKKSTVHGSVNLPFIPWIRHGNHHMNHPLVFTRKRSSRSQLLWRNNQALRFSADAPSKSGWGTPVNKGLFLFRLLKRFYDKRVLCCFFVCHIFFWYTPQKLIWNLKNDRFPIGISFFNRGLFSGSMLVLGGCNCFPKIGEMIQFWGDSWMYPGPNVPLWEIPINPLYTASPISRG